MCCSILLVTHSLLVIALTLTLPSSSRANEPLHSNVAPRPLTPPSKSNPYPFFTWEPNYYPLPHRMPVLTHIPMTAGVTTRKTMGKWGHFEIRHEEACFKTQREAYGWGAFMLSIFRQPRAHVFSQFLDIKYDGYGLKHAGRLFPRTGNGTEADVRDFKTWIDFYYDSWNKRVDKDINITTECMGTYHPYNLQARQLSDVCGAIKGKSEHTKGQRMKLLMSGGHCYPTGAPQSDGRMVSAITNMYNLSFVGLTELMPLSLCLLSHTLGPQFTNASRAVCRDKASDADLNTLGGVNTAALDSRFTFSPGTRHVPQYNITALPIDDEQWKKVDELTAFDLKLWKAAAARLFQNMFAFEQQKGVSLRHLVLPDIAVNELLRKIYFVESKRNRPAKEQASSIGGDAADAVAPSPPPPAAAAAAVTTPVTTVATPSAVAPTSGATDVAAATSPSAAKNRNSSQKAKKSTNIIDL